MKTQINLAVRKYLNTLFAVTIILSLFLTAKSNAQPVEDWVKRYNNFDKEDKANAMKVDKEGNVYVTGYSEGKGIGKDFLTIKYTANGDQIWASYYDGTGNKDGNDDIANAIALDAKGNVFVTGSSQTGVSGRDFCTVKYNQKGDQVWVVWFSGTRSEESNENNDNVAKGLVCDSEGSVYVTGNSLSGSSGMDFYTVKYNAIGRLIWANTFNGLANGNDNVAAICLDNSENIIVTGYCEELTSGTDYCTVKYNVNGEQLWAAKYTGIRGGNVVSSDDEAIALAADVNDNIYVTGYSYQSETGKDFLTIKYTSEGQKEWISRFDNAALQKGVRYDDEAKSLALDRWGNVYVTGKTASSKGGSDYLTEKISTTGKAVWSQVYNSESFDKSIDEATALVVDRKGNAYVTGFINGAEVTTDCGNERGSDFYTIKYSPEGTFLWGKQYDGTGGVGRSDDIAKAIALDGKGRIFVMGESMGDETEFDYCVIGYGEFLPAEENSKSEKAYYVLGDNFPNPFNPVTKISFNVPVSANVKLAIYDMSGREIATIVNDVLTAGVHQYEWNATQFSSGTYFYRLQSNGFVQTKKMMLIK